jgi:hypothetical protein
MPTSPTGGSPRKGKTLTFADAQALAAKLPGVEVGQSYGTPALKVKGKLLARLHDDGETLVVRATSVNREYLLEAWPRVFYLTDHYRDYPWVLVRLSVIGRDQLADVLGDAWELVAPPRMRAQRRGSA